MLQRLLNPRAAFVGIHAEKSAILVLRYQTPTFLIIHERTEYSSHSFQC